MKIVAEFEVAEWLPAKELMSLQKQIRDAVGQITNSNIQSKSVTIVM